MAAMQSMMGAGGPDPAKIQELMSDPEVGPVLQKMMGAMGGGMGGTVASLNKSPIAKDL